MDMFSVHCGDVKKAPQEFNDQRIAIDCACDLVKTLAPFAAVSVVDAIGRIIGVAIDDANGVRFRYLAGFEPAVTAFEHGKTGVSLQDICDHVGKGFRR